MMRAVGASNRRRCAGGNDGNVACQAPVATRRRRAGQIRIIFPYAAGGSGDALCRLVADKMTGEPQSAGDR